MRSFRLNGLVERVNSVHNSLQTLQQLVRGTLLLLLRLLLVQIPQGAVEKEMQHLNFVLGIRLLHQRLRLEWIGSRPGQTLRVIQIRLLSFNKVVSTFSPRKTRLQSRDDVYFRTPAPSVSVQQLDLRLEFLFKPSRLQ